MDRRNTLGGFTLLELLITLAVAAILLTLGMPDFGAIGDKRRLRGAAEIIHQDLRLARGEAIKRNRPIRVSFVIDDERWCYGIAPKEAPCVCTDPGPGQCEIDGVRRVRRSSDYQGIGIARASFAGGVPRTTFSPVHGTAGAGTVKLESDRGVSAWVRLSGLGRVRTCSPDGDNGYGLDSRDCH